MRRLFLGTVLATFAAAAASAATIKLELTCVLNPPSGSICQAGPSFGNITIEDTGANQVQLTVDLLNPNLKFRDLMLNLTGIGGITDITSSDGTNLTIALNGYSISGAQSGSFDLGVDSDDDNKGWNADAPYVTTLAGVGGTLTASMFNALDTTGKVYAAIHIQSIGPNGCDGDGPTFCTPGLAGNGSLKIGAGLNDITFNQVPEPATFGFVGVGLLGLALARRKRRA